MYSTYKTNLSAWQKYMYLQQLHVYKLITVHSSEGFFKYIINFMYTVTGNHLYPWVKRKTIMKFFADGPKWNDGDSNLLHPDH